MGARPITGWAYTPGAGTPWPALHTAFAQTLASAPPLARALDVAADRWGRSRLGVLAVRDAWPTEEARPGRGPSYTILGPQAHADALWTAWSLLEENLADAVLVRTAWVELLLERAASAALQLRLEAVDGFDLTLHPASVDCVAALVVASAAVDGGIACGDAGSEPDRVRVRMAEYVWTVEVRA